jgi:hypothetical protein
VQARLDNGRNESPRNTKAVYILQHRLVCGDCGGTIAPARRNYHYARMKSGKIKRYKREIPTHSYRCKQANKYPEETHTSPTVWNGPQLDWAVWRYLVDYGIKRPDLIIEQVQTRQAELIEQGDSVDGDINRARGKVAEIEQERAFYQRQAARGMITETEFDRRMSETAETSSYWQAEIERLTELRDNAAKVNAGLDYARQLMAAIGRDLPAIDVDPDTLAELPQEQRRAILKARRKIIRALCDKITVYPGGRLVIDGLLDGGEGAHFDLQDSRILSGLTKIECGC